ncbi:helix-turn-helix domain-containing protein [Treponema brennaborense]|uniref:Helix-turn-helix domain protein n=1 Tax=Treponema brennaborense (strain DSM 12168 / CIP 105900 / DD5/3) TaxID=906968 RepID=F4LJZ0_TREBD|nr:helix-turn-helix transcriptional regulator [Treponema brennaborense]AEE16470.1 helix-turn-helix domain protein [Treponema brennaborense DSM 12168]
MNFWERVDELLEEQDINKKTLAMEAGFNPSNITKGIKNNNAPSAETAVKIAQKLGVSVEYLVTGKNLQEEGEVLSAQTKELVRIYSKLSAHDKIILLALAKSMNGIKTDF